MSVQLFLSPKDHFEKLVDEGFTRLRLDRSPGVQSYLVGVLEFFLDTRNLYPRELDETGKRIPNTLAEMWLMADQLNPTERYETLKQVGDKALYVSGYFSDSLQRKLVDLDYYISMGETAYGRLADESKVDTQAQLYRSISRRFPKMTEVLNFVAQKSMSPTDANLLRTYERYLKTGSELAREHLVENGVLTLPPEVVRKSRQDDNLS